MRRQGLFYYLCERFIMETQVKLEAKIKELQDKLAQQNQFTLEIAALAEELYWGTDDQSKAWSTLIDKIETWRGWKKTTAPKLRKKRKRKKNILTFKSKQDFECLI